MSSKRKVISVVSGSMVFAVLMTTSSAFANDLRQVWDTKKDMKVYAKSSKSSSVITTVDSGDDIVNYSGESDDYDKDGDYYFVKAYYPKSSQGYYGNSYYGWALRKKDSTKYASEAAGAKASKSIDAYSDDCPNLSDKTGDDFDKGDQLYSWDEYLMASSCNPNAWRINGSKLRFINGWNANAE